MSNRKRVAQSGKAKIVDGVLIIAGEEIVDLSEGEYSVEAGMYDDGPVSSPGFKVFKE